MTTSLQGSCAWGRPMIYLKSRCGTCWCALLFHKAFLVLVAAMMGQIVSAADVDLYRGLLFWIKEQKNIEGNEIRQTSLPLSTVLDGSKAITFSGADLPERSSSAFSFAVSFKVGNLNCINRLFQLGRSPRHFYLDANNSLHYDYNSSYLRTVSWKVESVNKWYTIVVSHSAGVNAGGQLDIYAGERDTKLVKVCTQSEGWFFNCTSNEEMSTCFKLGQTGYPSSGYLTSGQFANVRFWTRALSNEECEMVDVLQNAPMSADDMPAGAPNGSAWEFFPLDGNAFRASSSNMAAVAQNTTLTNWVDSADRFGSENCAVQSVGRGQVVISNFESLFSGNYKLNNGRAFISEYGNYE